MAARADGLRVMRMVLFGLIVAVIVLAILIVIAFSAIQRAREDTVIRACQESNERYDDTIRQLNAEIARITDPVQRRRAVASRQGTIRLIGQLTPKTDCTKRAERLTK